MTPYNTGKVKIGLAFEPTRHRTFTRSEILVQRALLAAPKPPGLARTILETLKAKLK